MNNYFLESFRPIGNEGSQIPCALPPLIERGEQKAGNFVFIHYFKSELQPILSR